MWPHTTKLLAIVVCLGGWTWSAGAELASQTLHGALLLRNGEVLEGTATRSGDRFTIQLQSGGQLRIPVANVEFFGHDMGQVYRHQLSLVESDDADQFLQLSRWCLNHGMLKESAQCVLSASRLDPYHRELDRMERRLLEAARPRETATDVQHALHQEKRDVDPPALVQLHPGVVSEFSRRIQPILLNGCAAAACHRGPTDSEYQLHFPPRNRPMPQRLTLENLRRTLAWIENDDVEASRLLEQARTPHGLTNETGPPRLERRQYARLIIWARHATASRGKPDRGFARTSLEEYVAAEPSESADRSRQNLDGEPGGTDGDPFDPEVFNRMFLETEKAAPPSNDKTGEGISADPSAPPGQPVVPANDRGQAVDATGQTPHRSSESDRFRPDLEIDDEASQEP